VRPILIVADPPVGHLREVLALRLLRLHRLRSEERDLVRRQRHSRFFHLSPERFALPEESAAMVTALLRVHVDACASESLGTLGADDRAILGERIIRHYGFDPQLADRARR